MSNSPELSHFQNARVVPSEDDSRIVSVSQSSDSSRSTNSQDSYAFVNIKTKFPKLAKSKRGLELEAKFAALRAAEAALTADLVALRAEFAALKEERAKQKGALPENLMMRAETQSLARTQDQVLNNLNNSSGRFRSYAGFTTSRLIRRLE
jgi:hypothetical protein